MPSRGENPDLLRAQAAALPQQGQQRQRGQPRRQRSLLRQQAQPVQLVVIITDWEELQEPGTIYRAGDKKGQVGMIVDSSFVLSGEYGERSGNTCLYTGQRNFVEIFKEAMANEIKVIELTKGEKN